MLAHRVLRTRARTRAAAIVATLATLTAPAAHASDCDHLFGGAEGEAFQAALDAATGTARVGGNEVEILPEAAANYALRKELRAGAESFIHVYTLLIEDNTSGLESMSQFIERAYLDDIEVNVLLHGLSQAFDATPLIPIVMRLFGVRVREWYALNTGDDVVRFLLLAPHKKVLLVNNADYGLEAVVGGRNIGDNYFGLIPNPEPGEFPDIWRDTDIHVRGPILYDLMDDYIRRFNEQSGFEILKCPDVGPCPYYPPVSTEDPGADAEMRILSNEPDDLGGAGVFQINELYKRMLAQARDVVEIETPYFIPSPDLLQPLYDALARGVRVRILTNSPNSNDLGAPLFYASAFYWPSLIKAGAEFYMWSLPKPEEDATIFRTMHSKVATVDECLFVPGSWNYNSRSIVWSTEYAFPITTESLGAQAHEMFETDIAHDDVIPIDLQWFKDNWDLEDVFLAWFFGQFSPLL
ncbi:MAG: phosphatidylserine/phosphatidylglycerophosphate/cardiolipin synthase family protein [Myxococcales bacterium]|nr:phosphatidylserine/phosphatidylglycerophosphate/cardiolipin synthase family protein [Myxococcales bacterium]